MNGPPGEHNDQALEKSLYAQLHALAENALRHENVGHSLQPTLLVNDAYLRLLDQRNVDLGDRSQVLSAGSNIIRRILVDYARARKAAKRGGAAGRGKPLSVSVAMANNAIDILELHDALEVFGQERPRAAKVVEMRYFGGMSNKEVAEQLDVSERTVKNDWTIAKAWLYRELADWRNQTDDE